MMQQVLTGYLVNAAWQAPVVAFCALIVARFGGLSPQSRNRLWLGFLAIVFRSAGLPTTLVSPMADAKLSTPICMAL